MSDWSFLELNRVKAGTAAVPSMYWSDSSFGWNGLFRFTLDGRFIRCIASDGEGWQHVSVTIEGEKRCPSWELMCKIKNLFWEPEDVVIQFHPAKSEYVNNHPSCLHLWRPTAAVIPTPPSILVGLKGNLSVVKG